MINNYHTHTSRCGHAFGSDEEYVQSAIKNGIRTLGMSDHTPWPFTSEHKANVRMHISQLPEYVDACKMLKAKYSAEIDLKIGLECEYFEELMPWLDETIQEYSLDYIIFGNHFANSNPTSKYFGHSITNKEELERYTEAALKGMEYKKYAYLAHPDLFMRAYPQFDSYCEHASRKICEKAAKLHVPLEFNIGGYQMSMDKEIDCYPHDAFWKIAKDSGCTAIIGFDAHIPSAFDNREFYNRALKKIADLGIQRLHKLEI